MDYATLHKTAEARIGQEKIAGRLPFKLPWRRTEGVLADLFEQQWHAMTEAAKQETTAHLAKLLQEKENIAAELAKMRAEASRIPDLEKRIASLKEGVPKWPYYAAGGIAAAGLPTAYMLGRAGAEDKAKQYGLLGFGGGLAAGYYGPRLLRTVGSNISRIGNALQGPTPYTPSPYGRY